MPSAARPTHITFKLNEDPVTTFTKFANEMNCPEDERTVSCYPKNAGSTGSMVR